MQVFQSGVGGTDWCGQLLVKLHIVTFLVLAFLGLSTKKEGRVEQLWLRCKDKWKLLDRDSTKKWFNTTANARWKDHRTKVLKKNYDRAPVLATAKANRPDGMISSSTWEELCDQFFSISDSSGDGKSKSDKCRESRMKIPTDHHWGRTSISGWSHEHLQKFGKAPTVVDKYKKCYMRIDPLMPFVESGSSTEKGERAEPYTGIGTPEQRAIAEDLERVHEECINDGKDQSTADSIACERVLGKTKVLGIQSSTTKKVARSRFSSVRNEELETKVELLEGELQESRDEVSSLKESLNSLLNTLRQKGIIDQPVSKTPHSGTSNDDEERLNLD